MKYFKYNSNLYPRYAILYEVGESYLERYQFCDVILYDVKKLNWGIGFLSHFMYTEISKLEFESHFEL